MAFFQTDIDPIYLREQHRKVMTTEKQPIKQASQIPQHQTLFQILFSTTPFEIKPRSTITTDSMNRLVSFYL
ncbi:hypothetical protein A0J61_08973 [Choanephora cucurbitarum]|uniref:Uncharacterized protein n=1 Tax=Choanephora cucurbitarum TaxID=101091 RepID=A0A1C7N1P2_9FUNG|nr:hypothetical protein A0J61_08973 [Choanephora cucurbitarum]